MRYAMQFDQWLRGAAQTDILASQPAFLCKDAASRNPTLPARPQWGRIPIGTIVAAKVAMSNRHAVTLKTARSILHQWQ